MICLHPIFNTSNRAYPGNEAGDTGILRQQRRQLGVPRVMLLVKNCRIEKLKHFDVS
jgi:hypothetical protein